MMRPVAMALLILAALFLPSGRAPSAAPRPPVSDDDDGVWPILKQKCQSCHRPKKREGGLDMSSRETMLKGGNSGTALVPGDADRSLMIELIEFGEMPPRKQKEDRVTPDELKQLRAWIAAGAPTNGSAPAGEFGSRTSRPDAADKISHAFAFRDVTAEAGLLPEVAGIRGHGAGWGDADGDGWIDLYIGTFHTRGSKPNLFFRNDHGQFRLDDQASLRTSTRSTGTVFADLDNDGDLDLYVTSMPAAPGSRLSARTGHPIAPCTLFRNEGDGRYANIAEGNGACPLAFGGRSAATSDFDGDGLLDLLVGEDPLTGYSGSPTSSSRLFRNRGQLEFDDVSQQVGLPQDLPGLGVAAADVNNDGWPDAFFASSGEGGNRLFLNDRQGRLREAPGSRTVFAWPDARGENMVCGVAVGDVNRDGLLDIVLGQHFQSPWIQPTPNRLYLNRGIDNGVPRYEDVTQAVGLTGLPIKAPHVEIQDFDNDGWDDIYTSIVKFDNGRAYPLVFRNLGIRQGLPQFREDALAVNDFPTAEDRAIRRSAALFDKILAERKIMYAAAGPSGDYDNDGRLDLFLASWWTEAPSLLLQNVTPSGHWVDVQVQGKGNVNRMGVGSRVNVYPAGKLGEPASLLGCREIAVGYGYASAQPAIAHFGIGDHQYVDVEVVLPHRQGTIVRRRVAADQRITLTGGGR